MHAFGTVVLYSTYEERFQCVLGCRFIVQMAFEEGFCQTVVDHEVCCKHEPEFEQVHATLAFGTLDEGTKILVLVDLEALGFDLVQETFADDLETEVVLAASGALIPDGPGPQIFH